MLKKHGRTGRNGDLRSRLLPNPGSRSQCGSETLCFCRFLTPYDLPAYIYIYIWYVYSSSMCISTPKTPVVWNLKAHISYIMRERYIYIYDIYIYIWYICIWYIYIWYTYIKLCMVPTPVTPVAAPPRVPQGNAAPWNWPTAPGPRWPWANGKRWRSADASGNTFDILVL